MQDILRTLMESSQQGNAAKPAAGKDAMSELLGGLMGGQPAGSQAGDMANIFGVLENVMGGMQSGQGMPGTMGSAGMGDPLMQLLQPLVGKLAKKVGISPEIAMIVVAFVVQRLLASHPQVSSGTTGKSQALDLNQLFQMMGSQQGVGQDYLHSTGMVKDLAQTAGLDQATAAQSLNAVFGLLGGEVKKVQSSSKAKPGAKARARKRS